MIRHGQSLKLSNLFMSEHSYDFDFVVIGGGSAGYAAARTAHENGLKTAVIDSAETLGGLCILRGCMPSKTLIESANRMRSIRRSEEFGLWANDFGSDSAKINDRKRVLIEDFAVYRQGQLEDGRFELIRERAQFVDEHTLAVGDRKISFATALIASGSKVSRIPIPGLEEAGYWTSDHVLDAREYPDSIVVLGGGAIALEMACFFEGIGKEVTVIQRSDQVLTGSDRDVADVVEKAMNEAENCTVYTGTKLLHVEKAADGGKTVFFEHDGVEKSVTAGEILQSLGRSANTDGLGLANAGVKLRDRGTQIYSDNEQVTSCPHIFAAGDVTGLLEIVHIAIEQGEIAAHNAAFLLGKKSSERKVMDYRLKLLGIFTHPEVATVGLSEGEAEAEGRTVHVATYPFDDHGKSMVKGEIHGFVKLIADAESGELVGGAVVGPEAVDLIHEIVVAMYFRATASDLAKVPHYHPTLSEIWTYPAEDLAEM